MIISLHSIIGALMAHERKVQNKTQAQWMPGTFTQSTIGRMELGGAMTLENLEAFCNELGIRPWQLLQLADEISHELGQVGYAVVTEPPHPDAVKSGDEINGAKLLEVCFSVMGGKLLPLVQYGVVKYISG